MQLDQSNFDILQIQILNSFAHAATLSPTDAPGMNEIIHPGTLRLLLSIGHTCARGRTISDSSAKSSRRAADSLGT